MSWLSPVIDAPEGPCYCGAGDWELVEDWDERGRSQWYECRACGARHDEQDGDQEESFDGA